MCLCLYVCMYGMHVELRGQLAEVSSLLLLYGFQGMELGSSVLAADNVTY